MESLGELIERLSIANTKLFAICDKKANIVKFPANYSKGEIIDTIAKDIQLCKVRGRLKNRIDELYGSGQTEQVKMYGDKKDDKGTD